MTCHSTAGPLMTGAADSAQPRRAALASRASARHWLPRLSRHLERGRSQYLAPAFKQATGAAVTQSIVLGTDQVARLRRPKAAGRRSMSPCSTRRRCSMPQSKG